jgi:acyl-CoA thioester hydrolase
VTSQSRGDVLVVFRGFQQAYFVDMHRGHLESPRLAVHNGNQLKRANKMSEQATANGPLICPEQRVEQDWIDYNGHMNMAFYNVVFDRGVDHLFDLCGVGEEYAAAGKGTCFTLEAHVTYIQELMLGDPIRVELQLLDVDSKRIHFFEQMYHAEEGYLAATSEQITMHVDMQSRRSAPFPDAALARIDALMVEHRDLARPPQVGHVIQIPRKT